VHVFCNNLNMNMTHARNGTRDRPGTLADPLIYPADIVIL
jgi:hypothetical protein